MRPSILVKLRHPGYNYKGEDIGFDVWVNPDQILYLIPVSDNVTRIYFDKNRDIEVSGSVNEIGCWLGVAISKL